MSRRRRGLDPEERDLWDRVASRTTPMHPAKPQRHPDPPVLRTARDAPPRPDLPEFRIGEARSEPSVTLDLAHSVGEALAAQPLRMDRKHFTKMVRGKLTPDRRLDLHGLTLAEAHPRLSGFVLRAHADGARLVLVITGKGREADDDGPIPTRRGILRHQVPLWLSQPPLRTVVMQVAEAHGRHGGSGAYYVYLRRFRDA